MYYTDIILYCILQRSKLEQELQSRSDRSLLDSKTTRLPNPIPLDHKPAFESELNNAARSTRSSGRYSLADWGLIQGSSQPRQKQTVNRLNVNGMLYALDFDWFLGEFSRPEVLTILLILLARFPRMQRKCLSLVCSVMLWQPELSQLVTFCFRCCF